MNESQRDPDVLLARLRNEQPPELTSDASVKRGQLKIFFGYAAGVGKTYTMLEAARVAALGGRDVVLGYIEHHNRSETEALLLGQELIPARNIEYRGVKMVEFDVDAVLERKPDIVLVDELAHTNVPGCRHTKRWQDIQELLDSSIHVWTTLNVQHLESLNDVVAQITGVTVRETIPDRVFDEAAEVELVDLPPDELLERFSEGKVYIAEQAERAAERFFRKANLIALRELAMRRVADRVNREVQTARLGHTRTQTWPTNERLLVCVGSSPTSAKVIRTAKRMAAAMNAQWIAVHTETTARNRLDDQASHRLAQHLKLAERLGAETVTLTGDDVADEIVRYAQSRNVTKIVVGKTGSAPGPRKWPIFAKHSLVDRLVAQSGDIDVYVIRGVEEAVPRTTLTTRRDVKLAGYSYAAILLAVATALGLVIHILGRTDTNIVMTYLLSVVLIARWWGRWPGVFSSVAAVLLFNFFFTQPYYTFSVDNPDYIYTFILMLAIALIVSGLTVRLREQLSMSRERERRTEAMYRVSHSLAGTTGLLQLAGVAQEQLAEIFKGDIVIFAPEDSRLRPLLREGHGFTESATELEAAQWVFEHRQSAGRGTDTLPNAQALYLPLVGSDSTVGVLAWRPHSEEHLLDLERRQLLDAFATQIALALERDRLAQEAQRILAEAEAERLRSSLLSAVSHDLRTPLAAIAGSASSMVENEFDPATRKELAQTIYEESDRLSRLVENLLQLTRIESGHMKVQKQWQPLEEVVGSAVRRIRTSLKDHPVNIELAADLPMVPLDGLLIEQVLVNLLDNAAKYTPENSPIDITAHRTDDGMQITVADRGPGIDAIERERIFDKFYRSSAIKSDRGRGAGLGLAICRAIVTAHGGRIWADSRPGPRPLNKSGTCFRFILPMDGSPPVVDDVEPVKEADHHA